jgi:nucleoside-diphosphate-sugar epimerase
VWDLFSQSNASITIMLRPHPRRQENNDAEDSIGSHDDHEYHAEGESEGYETPLTATAATLQPQAHHHDHVWNDDERLTDSASDSLPDHHRQRSRRQNMQTLDGDHSNEDEATAANTNNQSLLRSSPTSIFSRTMGLHQRQRPRRNSAHRPDDDSTVGLPNNTNNADDYYSDYSYANPNNNNSSNKRFAFDNNSISSPDNNHKYYSRQQHLHHQLQHQLKKKRTFCFGTTMQTILLILAVSYLVLVVHIYRRVTADTTNGSAGGAGSERLLELVTHMEKLRLARAFLEEKQDLERRSAWNTQSQRWLERKDVRRPNQNVDAMDLGLLSDRPLRQGGPESVYNLMRHTSAARTSTVPEDLTLPASMEQLCGFHAQNASLTYPHNYTVRDALGPHSRVLITGVTDMLGIRLALLLQTRCHATVVAAIDPTFPNTIWHRLELLKPLRLLHKHLPKLHILWSYIGLDPLKKDKDGDVWRLLNMTGELDLVRSFRPTHIVHLANFFQTTDYNNVQHPYYVAATKRNGAAAESDDERLYQPSLYQIRSSLTAMEQILASIASTADDRWRPQFIYVSSSISSAASGNDLVLSAHTHMMQEIMADIYFASYGVQSTAIRMPAGVFGPWYSTNQQSGIHAVLEGMLAAETYDSNASQRHAVDLLYVDDAVDALLAAMQFRPAVPISVELESSGQTSWDELKGLARSMVDRNYAMNARSLMQKPRAEGSAVDLATRFLGWSPRTTVNEGLLRTMAWYLDQRSPFAQDSSSESLPGDALLERNFLSPCPVDDSLCHSGPTHHPCASECAHPGQCTPSIFDSIIQVTHEVTEGCEIVLYTQLLVAEATDFTLHTEYMDEGTPLICTVAFVAFESPIVQTVVRKVPEHEQVRLGVVPRPEDNGAQEALHSLKRVKLNGRLLYQGWILVWPDAVPDSLPHSSRFLLKLSPGRMFAKSVKHAVFIEEGFGVSPKHDDIKFLVEQLKRQALPGRTVKKKSPPKTKIRLPAEPPRRAVILMAELRQQESKRSRTVERETLSIRQASRFMRFETGEASLGRESSVLKAQREFYERMVSFVNRNTMRSPTEPQYTFAMKHWARTRWVVHDLELEEGRQLRCEWYDEHLQWDGSTLDQLSFAYVMAKRELERRIKSDAELSDRVLKSITDYTEIKRLLTDVFEWHALLTEENEGYTPYGELTALPYDHLDTEEGSMEGSDLSVDEAPLLFARIISDRTMATARGAWRAHVKLQKQRHV